jgi:hypothetical protein
MSGRYGVSEKIARASFAIGDAALGLHDARTLASMDSLASALRSQGKYDEVESMNRQALAVKENVLGVGHPDTLRSVKILALVLWN